MMTKSNPTASETPTRRETSAMGCPALTEVGQVGWRPVAEGLPDAGLTVLICQEGDQDSIEIGCCHGEEDWADVYGEALANPTHWRDLPEVPMQGEVAP